MKTILFVMGTRPEAIKLYPVINQFKKDSLNFKTVVLSTGQQKEMLDITLKSLELEIDIDLALMQSNQGLSNLTSELFRVIDLKIKEILPHYVFIHGDTTTSMVTGVVSKYNKILTIHIEAGLRTSNLMSPWPEEINRRINAVTSDYHIAPTITAAQNLINEGIEGSRILVTGNTGIDTLREFSSFISSKLNLEHYFSSIGLGARDFHNNLILVTIHRRENFNSLESIFVSLKNLAIRHKNYNLIFPVHLNPNVLEKAKLILSSIANIYLVEPVSYKQFVTILNHSKFIITDSGGIQEEASFLGKPIVLCRESTERSEGLDSMNIILAGTDGASILNVCERLIDDASFYQKYSNPSNVFGDGFASEKIFYWITNL